MTCMTLAAAAVVLHSGIGQTPPPATTTPPAAQPAQQPPKPDPFETATKDMESQAGMFKVYRKDDSVLFEIPPSMLGRDLLWWAEIKESPSNGYNGTAAGQRVVRFEQRGERLLLRDMDFTSKASSGPEIQEGVRKSNVRPIMAVFPVVAKSKEGGFLINVSRLFMGELPEMPVRRAAGGQAIDGSRSFLEKVVAFPDNINVEATMTYIGGAGGFSPFGPAPGGTPSITAVIHHSLVALPEKPMMGRLFDSRVGYFSTSFLDYGTDEHGVKEFQYINRFRLEKKSPMAELSEPVKPIVFYISREVPGKWHSYIKKAVEDWEPAFEAAGFKNAIECRVAPTVQQDPKWSAEDVRYNVIRWAPLPIANAMGPSVADPRSGEIISAHIIMWHDVLKLGVDWYFSQASPNDPRAQKLPMPDDLVGEILRFVVAHEVGHTLGLPHNGKSSAMVPVQLLRNAEWTAENGTAASIMDYARFNYVAQPGDGASLMPKVGPYDKFSIMWGYKPVLGANTPDQERPLLDAWAAKQVGDPMLRFYDNFSPTDPTAMSEALGDDAMEASRLGMLNLQRVMGYLVPATSRLGEDYSDLRRMHGAVMSQYQLYISHVVANVGGMIETDFRGGRGGEVYRPQTRQNQRRAVQWLNDWVLRTPEFLLSRSVLMRIGPVGGSSRMINAQSFAINSLLNPARLNRMVENEQMNGAMAYTAREMMADLRGEVWRELAQPRPKIDAYRRSMQRIYVNALIARLAGASTEIRAYALDDLKRQDAAAMAAVSRAGDDVTRMHLLEIGRAIRLAVENPAAPGTTSPAGAFPFINEMDILQHDGCLSCPAHRSGMSG